MSGANKKPEVIIFAGPNGSGKSTITRLLRPIEIPYVNADEIQRLHGCDNLEAAKIAEQRREELVAKSQDFAFETVLSTDRNLNLLRKAKEAGFFVRCYYVLTADPQINVARVASRVDAGGHDVPTEKIISRYYKHFLWCVNWFRYAMCVIYMTIHYLNRIVYSKSEKKSAITVRSRSYG